MRARNAPASAKGSAKTVWAKRTSPKRAGTSASPWAGWAAREVTTRGCYRGLGARHLTRRASRAVPDT